MSHIVRIATTVTDPVAVAAACNRLGLAQPVQGTARLYSGEASGLLVQLPGWKYPVVFDTQSGSAQFDHYGGQWGEEARLHQFLQRYAVEKCRLAARARGMQVHEQALQDGSIKVEIVEGGT